MEELILLLLELLAQRVVLVLGDELVERGEQHRILVSLVRFVHVDERKQRRAELRPLFRVLHQLHRAVRQGAPALMLRVQRLHQVH